MENGIIIFVIAVLVFAFVLIFWKPGVNTRFRFVRLSAGNLLIHLMDGLVTLFNTPDLSKEGNPLVSRLGLGWEALFTANLIGFVLVVAAAWYSCRYEHQAIPAKGLFDYQMKLFYGEDYKPVWFWYKISRNYRALLGKCAYLYYWGVTMGAPAFVIGWLFYMKDIHISWWRSRWVAFGVAVVTILWCDWLWLRKGYRLQNR